MKLVMLWTDLMLWTILVIVAISIFNARNSPIARETWFQIFRRPVAIVTFIILSCYLSIAMLDSLHFQRKIPTDKSVTAVDTTYSPKVESLLDLLLDHLRNSAETSYSSPFSAYAWVKESVEQDNGSVVRDYPRLRNGAAHLEYPGEQLVADICQRSCWSCLIAVFFWSLIIFGALVCGAQRSQITISELSKKFISGRLMLPWRSAALTLLPIMLLISLGLLLSPYYHVLGTDQVGKDVLYMSLKSIRTGVAIGLITTLVLFPLAVVLGVSAGYFGGWIDDLIQYVYITLNSIPGVLLIVASVMMIDVHISNNAVSYSTAASRADLKLLALCFVLGMTSWTSLCRLLRAETIKLRELEYVQAARAFGVYTWRILARHVFPNLTHLVILTLVMDFSGLVLAEAVLSYIGVGVDPSMESWGNMINSARLELARVPMVWWPLFAAFIFMSTLVLSANLFADVVREALDPRTRERNP